jgi:hypothetical protein
MNKFEIKKHPRVFPGRALPGAIECSEAFATYDKANGYRLAGFEADGRRWTIAISDSLAIQLCAQVAAVKEREQLREAVPS